MSTKTTGGGGDISGLSSSGSAVEAPPSGISSDKIEKIHKDLDTVRNNMTVFSEMLLEMQPGGQGNDPADLELLQELYKTCKEMQNRVGQLLCSPTTDQLTVDMLQINDDLNDLFDRYDRKTAGNGRQRTEMPLIDLGDEGTTPSLISDLRAMNVSGGVNVATRTPAAASAAAPSIVPKAAPTTTAIKQEDDFDSFIQSRQSAAAAAPPTNTKPDTNPNSGRAERGAKEEEIIEGHRETDFEEMEAWLKANPGADTSLMSIPNPQFDNYLAERAQSRSSSHHQQQ